SLARNNRHKGSVGFQRLQFCFILNAREIKAVDFSILNQERFMRRLEQRIPTQPAEMPMTCFRRGRVVNGKRGARHAAADESDEKNGRKLFSYVSFHQVFTSSQIRVQRLGPGQVRLFYGMVSSPPTRDEPGSITSVPQQVQLPGPITDSN